MIRDHLVTLKVEIDEEAGLGYLYLAPIKAGEVEISKRPSKRGDFVFDFNADGQLVGIEFLSLDAMPNALKLRSKEG